MNDAMKIVELECEIESLKRRLDEANKKMESVYACAAKACKSGLTVDAGVIVTDDGIATLTVSPNADT